MYTYPTLCLSAILNTKMMLNLKTRRNFKDTLVNFCPFFNSHFINEKTNVQRGKVLVVSVHKKMLTETYWDLILLNWHFHYINILAGLNLVLLRKCANLLIHITLCMHPLPSNYYFIKLEFWETRAFLCEYCICMCILLFVFKIKLINKIYSGYSGWW